MLNKQIIRINASSLILSRCILAWHRTIIQGYKTPAKDANIIYGIAGHKYIDTMFKTKGRIDLARNAALKAFKIPKYDNKKSLHLSDELHLFGTCYNLWEDYIIKDQSFDHLQLNSKCWWCDGNGCTEPADGTGGGFGPKCEHCKGKGTVLQPATEVTFSIKYYEDDLFIVLLEGTIDKIGKIRGGCYAIGDYKFTSSWDEEGYLDKYEMSAPLRFYLFSLKLMAQAHPDSVLGKIGATNVGAFIDGIFIKSKNCNNTYKRSRVFQFSKLEMDKFKVLLDMVIDKLLTAIRSNKWDVKEGLLNGSCDNANKYNKCAYWLPCKSQNDDIEKVLLGRNFIQKSYQPLHHND